MRKNKCTFFTWFASLLILLLFAVAADPQIPDCSGTENNKANLERELNVLVQQVEATQAECDALDSHLAALNISMAKNCMQLEEVRNRCMLKQEQFNARIGEIYKNGHVGVLEVLLNGEDFEDLWVRACYIQEINKHDADLVGACQAEKKRMTKLHKDLEVKKLEALSLRKQRQTRLADLRHQVSEKQRLLRQADLEIKQRVKMAEEQKKAENQRVAAASSPAGSPVKSTTCSVSPYLSGDYVTSERFPARFVTTGIIFSGVASWYGNEFNGRSTASGERFNENDFTCASRTLPFGTYLAVSYGNRRIVVRVNDRGPFVKGRILDLSKGAAQALGISGIGHVQAEIVKPE